MAKNIYDGKVTGKRGSGRHRLAFENTVLKILEEDHVKSVRTPGEEWGRGYMGCMKRLMTVDKAKEERRDRSG